MERVMPRRVVVETAGARGRGATALALTAVLLMACGTTIKPYAGPGLARDGGTRMAILPFENLSKAPGAARTLEGMVLVELLRQAPVAIVDPGEVSAALSKERVRIATSMSREALAAVARDLGVDLVMMGTLHDYDMQMGTGVGGSSQIPVLAATLRAVDARSGEIVWAANAARRGTDKETVFGIGRVHSLNTLAEEAAADLAGAFAASMRRRRAGDGRPSSAPSAPAPTPDAPPRPAPAPAPTPDAPPRSAPAPAATPDAPAPPPPPAIDAPSGAVPAPEPGSPAASDASARPQDE